MLKINSFLLGRRLCLKSSRIGPSRYSSTNSLEEDAQHQPRYFRDFREIPKNPNQIILRGDVYDVKRDEEQDRLSITLQCKRQSTRKDGLQYIKSDYYYVNFFSVNDPQKNWKLPKYVTIGDNVTTYSNLHQSESSDQLYLKGYAMVKHDTRFAMRSDPEGDT